MQGDVEIDQHFVRQHLKDLLFEFVVISEVSGRRGSYVKIQKNAVKICLVNELITAGDTNNILFCEHL